jgi:flagellar biogenesis protein FliO
MWRYLLSLVAVGGLMAGAFFGLRRMRTMLGGSPTPGGLRLVARLSLDRHNTVYLLRTAGETLVLAGGVRGVRVISRQANAPEQDQEAPPARPSFLQTMRAKERES